MTLAEKLHAIQKLARKVPKNGYNEREDFHYMQAEDVITIGTRFLSAHELILTPTLKSLTRTPNERGGGSISDVVVAWTLREMKQDGELVDFDIPGSGWDYTSKSTAKAMTDSRKGAFIYIFNLKGGEDPESRGPISRDAGKDAQERVKEQKLADAADGKGIDASVPKIFYEIFEQSQTVELTGDKNLLKAPSLKKYKLGGKFVVKSAEWDKLRETMENEGVAVSNLRTQ